MLDDDIMLKFFFTSTFLYTLGSLFPTLSGLVLLFPYTQNLSIGDYGTLAILISFTLFMQIVINYGIDNYIAIHYFNFNDNPLQLKRFISTMAIFLLFIGATSIVLMALTGNLLLGYIFKDKGISFFPYCFMSVATAFFNVLFKTYTTLLIYLQKPLKFFLFNLVNFIATVLLSWILLDLYPHTLIGPMWGRLLSGLVIFLLSLSFYIREYGIGFDRTKLSGLQKFCTPILAFGLLSWIIAYIFNYILKGTENVGVFAFAMQCTLLIEFSQNGLTSAINPKIYHLWKDRSLVKSTPEENKYHHLYTLVTILLISLSILLLPLFVPLFVKKTDYYSSFTYLPYLCAGFAFRGLYNIFINPIYYFKKTNTLPRMLFISAIFQIVCGIVLIKYFGIWGAVWSSVLVKPIQVLLLWQSSRKLFAFKFNLFKMIFLPILYVTGVIVIYQFPGYSNSIMPGILQFLFASLLILIAFKNELHSIPLLFKKT